MAVIVFEQSVQRYLAARPALRSLLGTAPPRLWVGKLPQGPTYPCVSFMRVATEPVDALDDGPSGFEFVRLQFSAWCGDYYTAKKVAETLRLELMGFRGSMDGIAVGGVSYEMGLDLYDDDARDADADTEGVHHIVSDFRFGFVSQTS